MRSFSSSLQVVGNRPLPWLALGVLLGVALALVEFGFGRSLQAIVEAVGRGSQTIVFRGHTTSLFVALISLSAFGVTKALILVLLEVSTAMAQEHVLYRLRQIALYKLLLSPAEKEASIAEHLFFHGTVTGETGEFLRWVSRMIPQAVLGLGLITLGLSVQPYFAAMTLLLLVPVGTLVLLMNRETKRLSEQQTKPARAVAHAIERVTGNWLLLRIMGTNTHEYRNAAALNVRSSLFAVRAVLVRAVGGSFPNSVGIIFVAILLYLWQRNAATQGASLAFVTLFYVQMRLLQAIANLANFGGEAASRMPYFLESARWIRQRNAEQLAAAEVHGNPLRYDNLRRVEQETPSHQPESSVTIRKASRLVAPELVCRHVSFEHRSGALILNQFDLRLSGGEHLGIRGPSGAGKTTVLSLLVGLRLPSSGSIQLGGIDASVSLEERKNVLAYVGPDPFLVAGTVRDNLDYGREEAYADRDYEEVLELVQLAGKSLDTPIGVNGSALSAGEKQRLSLARALLRRPQLLVLDEPTSNLDERTESFIVTAIQSLRGRTSCLISSHREAPLAHVDAMLELPSQTLTWKKRSRKKSA